LYQKGEVVGIAEGKELVIKNLLKLDQFTIAEIARIGEVPEDTVLQVKSTLNL
jgi:hypothetical protein